MINTVWDGNLQVDEGVSAFGEATSHLCDLIRNNMPQWTMSINRGSFGKLEVKVSYQNLCKTKGYPGLCAKTNPLDTRIFKHLDDDALTKHQDTLILQQLQFNIFLCTDINCKLLTFVTTFKSTKVKSQACNIKPSSYGL